MMRPLLVAVALAAIALTGLATPTAANDACVPYPDGNHINHICVSTEQCSALGFCIDAANPVGTVKDLQAWAKEQTGPCTCDPQPDPGP